MSKAFWTIVGAVNDGGALAPNIPNLPSVAWVSPFDINRLTAGAGAAAHVHTIVGGVALMSDQAGGAHEHYVVGGAQALHGTATAHTHPDPGAADFFMCFVRCSDADYSILTSAPYTIRPIVQVTVNADGSLGAMDTAVWSGAELTTWQTLALNQLGLQLPAQVDRGQRLWLLLAGCLMSRRPGDDRGFR